MIAFHNPHLLKSLNLAFTHGLFRSVSQQRHGRLI